METASANQENAGQFTRSWCWLKALPEKSLAKVVRLARMGKKLGQDDPRRIVHSLKVALALTLVSLFYYFKPLYEGFGVSAMWAVLTVVVVFEFTVGATFGKGINRMLATLVGGPLAVGAHHITGLFGGIAEPILIGFFVFLIAAAITFIRFCPRMKARYDYGLMIFILTFCLITVSGYRTDEVVEMAQKRISTIIIGSCVTMIVCIAICPIWMGENLHNLVAGNIENIGSFLEGFGSEYFKRSEDGQSNDDKSFLQTYKSALRGSNERHMANLARWEPPHGQFKFGHPWKQYLRIGSLTRQCAYKIESLNTYLTSEIQTPANMRSKIQEPCTKISSELGQALKGLASAIKTMTRPSSVNSHIENSKTAVENLKASLRIGLWEDANLLEIVPAAAVASLLIEIVTHTGRICEAVQELASLANFKSVNLTVTPEQPNVLHQGAMQPFSGKNEPHHVITVDDAPSPGFPEKGNPSAPSTGQRMEA